MNPVSSQTRISDLFTANNPEQTVYIYLRDGGDLKKITQYLSGLNFPGKIQKIVDFLHHALCFLNCMEKFSDKDHKTLEKIEYIKSLVNTSVGVYNNEPRVLYKVCRIGLYPLAESLIHRGFDINKTDEESGVSALHLACYKGKTEAVKWLCEKGAEIDKLTADNHTPLHYAVMQDDPKISELLLDHGATINAVNTDRCTALHLACFQKKYSNIIYLLKRGADFEIKDDNELQALDVPYYICRNVFREMYEYPSHDDLKSQVLSVLKDLKHEIVSTVAVGEPIFSLKNAVLQIVDIYKEVPKEIMDKRDYFEDNLGAAILEKMTDREIDEWFQMFDELYSPTAILKRLKKEIEKTSSRINRSLIIKWFAEHRPKDWQNDKYAKIYDEVERLQSFQEKASCLKKHGLITNSSVSENINWRQFIEFARTQEYLSTVLFDSSRKIQICALLQLVEELKMIGKVIEE